MALKKVLVITYYWPPSGGAGVQRVLKFVKYMRDFGWEPVILTVEDGEYPALDYSLEKDIPEGIQVYKTKYLNPFNIYKNLRGKQKGEQISVDLLNQKSTSLVDRFAKWVRFNIFIPDPRIGWYFHAIKAADRIVKEHDIQVVFSTSPPNSLQVIAKKIALKHHLKWVADFRDPWWFMGKPDNKLVFKINEKLQDSVLRHASTIITVGENMAIDYRKRTKSEIFVITNGYDAQDLPVRAPKSDQSFTITYSGNVAVSRIPYPLIHALKELKKSHNNLRLQFIGGICKELQEEITAAGIEDITTYKGYLRHDEALKELAKSDLQLLVINNIPNNQWIITGKIFEYLGLKIPILGIGPADGDAARIINDTRSGYFVSFEDNEKTYNIIEHMLNYPDTNLTFDVEKFNRRSLTGELCSILEQTISKEKTL